MIKKRKSILAFVFGLGAATQIRVIGSMAITEAVCIILAPFLLRSIWPKLKAANGHRLIGWLLLWLISAVISDVYRETQINDALKGIFVLPFLFATFVSAFALLWDDLTRVKWIAMGMAISGVISIYYFKSPVLEVIAKNQGVDTSELVDFKNTYSSTFLYWIFVLVILIYKKWPRIMVFILIACSALYLHQGTRNGFLSLFLCAVGAWMAKNHFSIFRSAQRNISVLLILLIAFVVGATEIYAYSVKQGWLGDGEFSKYEQQSQSEIGLLSGRSGFFAAILVIQDSPIIGLGSWAKDKQGYNRRFYDMIDAPRETVDSLRYKKVLLAPGHSHIMQAWVWHGLFGGIFWIVVIVMTYRFFRYAVHLCRPMIAYNLLLLTTSMWSLLFSPFANRTRWGNVFAILVLSLAEVERRRKARHAGIAIDPNEQWDGKWKDKYHGMEE